MILKSSASVYALQKAGNGNIAGGDSGADTVPPRDRKDLYGATMAWSATGRVVSSNRSEVLLSVLSNEVVKGYRERKHPWQIRRNYSALWALFLWREKDGSASRVQNGPLLESQLVLLRAAWQRLCEVASPERELWLTAFELSTSFEDHAHMAEALWTLEECWRRVGRINRYARSEQEVLKVMAGKLVSLYF